MQTLYQYEVRNESGQLIRGQLEAKSPEEVIINLKRDGYYIAKYPVEIRRVNPFPVKRMADRDVAILSKNLADLLDAGVPILNALKLLREKSGSSKLKGIYDDIISSLENGDSFNKSLQKQDLFPTLFCHLVTIGEHSGNLVHVLLAAHKFYDSRQQLLKKTKRQMLYPSLILVMSLFVLWIFTSLLLPEVKGMITSQGGELPLPTIIMFSFFSSGYYLTFLLLLLGAVALFILLKAKYNGILEAILRRLPVVGRLRRLFFLTYLCKSQALLLQGGYSLVGGLKLSAQMMGHNSVLRRHLQNAVVEIEEGGFLSEAMEKLKIFSQTDIEIIKTGEEAGKVAQVFLYLSDYYENRLAESLDTLAKLFEPLLIILMTIFVGLIVGAILMPLYDMLSFTF